VFSLNWIISLNLVFQIWNMLIKIALIISIVLQFGAAIIAITLIKRTRANIAWWLISIGFLLMAIRRVFEIIQVYNPDNKLITGLLSSWTGVLISIIMLVSLVFIKRIFNIQKQIDDLRKQNENRVLSAILKTEENERQHFANELHDGLGPLLSSVKMAISVSRYNEKDNDKVLENAEKLIDESITSLRDISTKLSPHILVNFGLLKAVKSFVNNLQIADKPLVSINSNLENHRFLFNVEVVFYRIICELITNTLKHANSHNIVIDLFENNNTISLIYTDDGIGFDERQIENDLSGLGYFNMKSRIKSLNGTYCITSKPNEGFRINISIKLI